MINNVLCAYNGNVRMETDTISKNGRSQKNWMSMRNFLMMLCLSAFIVFSGCDKGSSGSSDSGSGGGLSGGKVTASVKDGAKLNNIVSEVVACINGEEIASGKFASGGFTIELPTTLQAKYLHDMSVAIDVLCALDYVDTTRLGVIGHSLGGQTSLYTTWYDERIKAGVSSCGFGTMETITGNKINHNKAMYIPGFSEYADTYDTLCDIAPRAFAFTSGIKDDIFPIDGVREIEKKAKKRYADLDAADKLLTHIFNGGHSFDGDAKQKVYSFLDRELK